MRPTIVTESTLARPAASTASFKRDIENLTQAPNIDIPVLSCDQLTLLQFTVR